MDKSNPMDCCVFITSFAYFIVHDGLHWNCMQVSDNRVKYHYVNDWAVKPLMESTEHHSTLPIRTTRVLLSYKRLDHMWYRIWYYCLLLVSILFK